MSLEIELAANTAAIKELTAAWKALAANARAVNPALEVKAGGVPVIAAKVEAPKPAPTPDVPVTVTSPPATESVSTTTVAASPSEAPVEIKDLSAAVTAAATRNRDGLVALLSKHKVKRASEVPQDQWAALIAELGAL